MKFSAVPFYRPPSNESACREDGHFIDEKAGIVVVTDGVSEPYVGKPCDYGLGRSGGTVVSTIICNAVSGAKTPCDLLELLLEANTAVFHQHASMGRDPARQAVAGACVAACQISEHEATFVVVGDAGVLWEDQEGSHFLTNFNTAAHVLEEAGNEFFEACKHYAAMVGAQPWGLYRPFFDAKQFYRANRHTEDCDGYHIPGRNGGHGMVNGNPAVQSCWTVKCINPSKVKWILLLTDGLLWRDFRPENHQEVADAFNRGGLDALVKLRDGRDNQPHIQAKGWPEATAIVLMPK